MKWLRLTLSYIALVLAALVGLLWLRSYFYSDVAARVSQYNPRLGYTHAIVESLNGKFRGHIYYLKSRDKPQPNIAYQFRTRDALPVALTNQRGFLGFYWRHEVWGKEARYVEFRVPHWPFVFAFFLFAIALRPKPRWRYSVRDLLVFLTTTAAVIGIIVGIINSSGLYGFPVDFRWV
jgi:hypothetical protein